MKRYERALQGRFFKLWIWLAIPALIPAYFYKTDLYLLSALTMVIPVILTAFWRKLPGDLVSLLIIVNMTCLGIVVGIRNADWVYSLIVLPIIVMFASNLESTLKSRLVYYAALLIMILTVNATLGTLGTLYDSALWTQIFMYLLILTGTLELMITNAAEVRQYAKTSRKSELSIKNFLTGMSHELRTPLAGIMGANQIIMTRDVDLAEAKDLSRAAYDAAKHMLSIVEDILDTAKITSDDLQLSLAPVDLSELAQVTYSNLVNAVANRPIEVVNNLDPQLEHVIVNADRQRLQQVLFNLTSNASKFTQQGRITLGMRQLVRGNTTVSVFFTVEDTGPGIPEDKIAEIFTPFTQGSTRVPGSGLGLSIAQGIVKAMGGEILVKSVPGQGSLFTFSLTFQTEQITIKPAVVHLNNYAPQDCNTLLVDDNQVNLMVLEATISNLCSNIHTMDDPVAALEYAIKHKDTIHLVITDGAMPVLGGIELSKQLRAAGYTGKIVMCSGTILEDTELPEEIDLFLFKPFDVDTATAKIRNLMQKK